MSASSLKRRAGQKEPVTPFVSRPCSARTSKGAPAVRADRCGPSFLDDTEPGRAELPPRQAVELLAGEHAEPLLLRGYACECDPS